MSFALLFSGQGGQHAAMLPWLDDEPAAQPALAALGAQLARRGAGRWRRLLTDPTARTHNANAQLLLTGTALAAWAALAARLPQPPAIVAGYSVGELAACACAGAIGGAAGGAGGAVDAALALAAQRAEAMDRAVAGTATGLLAVSGLSDAQVAALCAGLGLDCAIRIGPDQTVQAGTASALDAAAPRLAAAGASCRRLAVGVASHSRWMEAAAREFAAVLQTAAIADARWPVAVDAGGQAEWRADRLRTALSQQLARTVEWAACMDSVAERGVRCVLEIGPGDALARMWSARHPGIAVRAVDDFRKPDGVVAWIRQHGQR